ncbi:MAG: hypothetical protein M3126_08010, partial [Candidatus Eremiobacteraeota bacterium]|nr:hypothetical protein [Candidatus Eremiobacteraeota bacterium]
GKGRAGDITFAREALTAHAIPIMAIENAVEGGERISSTRIRALILEGRMDEAQALLGHAFEVRGRVVLGAGRGHDLGFPTANVEPATDKIHPKDGVYAAMARYDGRDYPALVSIGTNPTFGGVKGTIEAWLRDFDRSIYGEELALREFRFVRDQVRFANAQELVAQMEKDLSAVAYPSYG